MGSVRAPRQIVALTRDLPRCHLEQSEVTANSRGTLRLVDGTVHAAPREAVIPTHKPRMTKPDIVISSTACLQIILSREEAELIARERANHPLVLVDLALPRDIAPDVREVLVRKLAGSLARELKELPEKQEQEQLTTAVQRLFHLEESEKTPAALTH